MKKIQFAVSVLALFNSILPSSAKVTEQKMVSAKVQNSGRRLPEPDGSFVAQFPLRIVSVGSKTTFISGDGAILSLNKKIENVVLLSEGNINIRSSGIAFSLEKGTMVVTGKGRIKVQWNIKD